MVRGFWYAFATPNPALRGSDRDAMTFPLASYGRFVAVTRSLGLDKFIVVFRPEMIAEFGAFGDGGIGGHNEETK
jgi:hypothetical protein